MLPEEKKSLTNAQKNVMHLRYKLTQHQIDGNTPPASLLVELKMAKLLVKLESIDTMNFKPKVMYKV